MAEFEWDQPKRLNNLEKHDIDFADAEALFDGRPIDTQLFLGDEVRFGTVGILNGRFVTAVWTLRGTRIRLISVRRSSDEERRRYRRLYE
jgi:uncharacterized DUF497 family protein